MVEVVTRVTGHRIISKSHHVLINQLHSNNYYNVEGALERTVSVDG